MADETISEKVHIYSGEWGAYWRPEGAGYTQNVAEAGVWTREEAESRTSHCDAEKKIRIMPVAVDTPEQAALGNAAVLYAFDRGASVKTLAAAYLMPEQEVEALIRLAVSNLMAVVGEKESALAAARSEAGALQDLLRRSVERVEHTADCLSQPKDVACVCGAHELRVKMRYALAKGAVAAREGVAMLKP